MMYVFVAFGVAIFSILANPSFGARSRGRDFDRLKKSAQFVAGRFQNIKKLSVATRQSDGGFFTVLYIFLFKDRKRRTPQKVLPSAEIDTAAYQESYESDILTTWLGHSTILMRMDSQTIITDPIFSKRASFVQWFGPQEFTSRVKYSVDDLPPVDVVVISHDHYDHLDHQTIASLKDRVKKFFVPLGVEAHLLRWGVHRDKIISLDWHESYVFEGIVYTLAPARHFSGRTLTDRMRTLWGSWIIKSGEKNVYFSGDSGYSEEFRKIGAKYGPFDIAFMECGAYSEQWADVHLFPEQTVEAATDIGASILLPIHNGKFNLSLHSWTEPLDRVLAEGRERNFTIVTPLIGETFRLGGALPQERWWQDTY